MAEPLSKLQRGFAAHLRDPDHAPPPADVEDRRMAIYRDLFFRNLSGFVARSFPVLRRLYEDAAWQELIREFFRAHRCRTPLFPEIPREFLQFLQDREGSEADPPFVLELAHYEWVEIALDLDEAAIEDTPADRQGDLLAGIPVVSPLAWPLTYRFPVHRIRPDFQPQEPPAEPSHLLAYRGRDDRVRFMQLNAVTAALLARLKENPGLTGQEVLQELGRELHPLETDQLLAAGAVAMEDLRRRDVILGSRPTE